MHCSSCVQRNGCCASFSGPISRPRPKWLRVVFCNLYLFVRLCPLLGWRSSLLGGTFVIWLFFNWRMFQTLSCHGPHCSFQPENPTSTAVDYPVDPSTVTPTTCVSSCWWKDPTITINPRFGTKHLAWYLSGQLDQVVQASPQWAVEMSEWDFSISYWSQHCHSNGHWDPPTSHGSGLLILHNSHFFIVIAAILLLYNWYFKAEVLLENVTTFQDLVRVFKESDVSVIYSKLHILQGPKLIKGHDYLVDPGPCRRYYCSIKNSSWNFLGGGRRGGKEWPFHSGSSTHYQCCWKNEVTQRHVGCSLSDIDWL